MNVRALNRELETPSPPQHHLPRPIAEFAAATGADRQKIALHLRGEQTALASWIKVEIDRLRGDA